MEKSGKNEGYDTESPRCRTKRLNSSAEIILGAKEGNMRETEVRDEMSTREGIAKTLVVVSCGTREKQR